jgi:hypothetical protein
MLEVAELSMSELVQKKKSVEHQVSKDDPISENQRVVIEGFSKKPTIGPFRDA